MTTDDKIIEMVMDKVGDYSIRHWLRELFKQYRSDESPSTELQQAQERIKELQQQFDLVYKEWLALKIKYERDDFQKAHELIQAALNPKP
jgi:hypothetical protein